MENRTIFVEGIPGSGKTTCCNRMESAFQMKGENVFRINECEKNPLDLSRCAIVTESEYHIIQSRLATEMCHSTDETDRYLKKLEAASEHVNNRVYVFFQELICSKELNALGMALRNKDIYGGHIPFERFREEHLLRWRFFAAEASRATKLYIADAILLQSPLFELIGYYNLPYREILRYCSELLECVTDLLPKVYYIYISDVQEHLKRVCRNRTKEGDPWERGFYKWMANSPFCIQNHYSGFEGMCAFLKERQDIELQLLKDLKCEYELINDILDSVNE